MIFKYSSANTGGKKQLTLISRKLFAGMISACHCSLMFIAAMLLCAVTNAQTNKFLQQGNKLYDEKKYDEATNSYLKALEKDPNNATGLFNLGNALYQQNHIDSARKVMSATASALKDKNGKAAANYNIGNTYMAQRKWEDAASAYKNTLRNNPQDVDAKYNLSYAEQMLKKQQGGGGNKDKKDNKDQQKDKQQQQDKNKQDKGKDKQDQPGDDKDKDKQDDKYQKPQGKQGNMTQQQADQVLNALQQEEKKLQDKLKKEKGIPTKLAKDW